MSTDKAGIPADALQLTWDDVEALSVGLAEQVKKGGESFDKLVMLQRGGAFPANLLSRRLNMPADRVISASVSSYMSGTAKHNDTFMLGQFPTEAEVRCQRLLVVDEVCDSGRTLDLIVRKLTELGAAKVSSAVLHYKPTKSETGYVPDFYVSQTSKWICYPWEPHDEAGQDAEADVVRTALVAEAT